MNHPLGWAVVWVDDKTMDVVPWYTRTSLWGRGCRFFHRCEHAHEYLLWRRAGPMHHIEAGVEHMIAA